MIISKSKTLLQAVEGELPVLPPAGVRGGGLAGQHKGLGGRQPEGGEAPHGREFEGEVENLEGAFEGDKPQKNFCTLSNTSRER